MKHKLEGHDPLQDKKFRTLKVTGKTAKLTTTTIDDSHTAMRAYKEYLNPPKIEREPDWEKADPLFAPSDYTPPKKVGGKRVAADPDNPKYKQKNDRITLKNRKQNLYDIGLMNFCKENSSFVTLTIDPKLYPADNLAFCHKAFQHFIRSLKNLYSGIAYIVVYERGAVKEGESIASAPFHIHVLWNIININRYTIDKYWHKGIVDVKKTFSSTRAMLEYMGKSFDEIDKFNQAFNYSKNLHTATIYRESKGEGEKIDKFFEEQGTGIRLQYSSQTNRTQFVDSMEFEQFNLSVPHTNYVPIAKLKKNRPKE